MAMNVETASSVRGPRCRRNKMRDGLKRKKVAKMKKNQEKVVVA
jgi:hypothetical protein